MEDQSKKTVYRFRYTVDNRIKAVEVSQEPFESGGSHTYAGWLVVAAGAILAVVWWLLWL
ncbi:hypothetical protein ABEV74_19475 [Paenibacillus cisolokensis]|uniref:hypothetical protein n=1 Tax=Paenibacillus cisolokensis TaxID=1658519 RepID=UPI003D288CBB